MPELADKKKELLEELMKGTIYDAAWSLMKESGWESFSMGRLAERAGVSKGTIYNYFKDKRELLWFILDKGIEEVTATLDQLIASASSWREALEKALRYEMVQRERHAGVIVSIMHAIHQDRELQQRAQSSEFPVDRIRRRYRQILEGGVESGEFREISVDTLEMLCFSLLIGTAKIWNVGNGDVTSGSIADTVFSILQKGLYTERGTDGQ
ncbi:MAG: TetR/AcrR family transcriptional regulator [Synergistales bacterium]|nr:TetR/AcrR family transcriptional regulator [Synergistales bacterium]